MVDLSTVSIMIASAGVFAAAVYYIWQIRHQTKLRQTDMLWRIYSSFCSKEFTEAVYKLLNLEFKDYNDFVKKYGPPFSESPVAIATSMVATNFEGLGQLLRRKLVDADLLFEFTPVSFVWEKIQPLVEPLRHQFNIPFMRNFEYLYNEEKKRKQR